MKHPKSKKIIISFAAVILSLALLVGGCAIYVADYYPADRGAIAAFAAVHDVHRREIATGVTAYGDADADVGLIFYPGGKVEHTAYEPLMRQLAESGVLCILIEMPLRLAVLDINAADGVREQFPSVEHWYIGGHSLGGSMAALYAQAHAAELDGLILLGSYASCDLSGTDLRVLSVYGSEDGVMNREKYERYQNNLPASLTEVEIAGGCHAYFGMYGAQKGDGVPALRAEEQIRIGAEHISNFILKGEN